LSAIGFTGATGLASFATWIAAPPRWRVRWYPLFLLGAAAVWAPVCWLLLRLPA
jgi:hypothetical protein